MYPYIDMHCDSLLRVLEQGENALYNGAGMQSILRMAEAGQMCQFFAVFLRPQWEDAEAERYFITLRNALYSQALLHAEKIAIATNFEEILANRAFGKTSAVLTLEDGRIVNGQMEKLYKLYDMGVRAIALTWNKANCFGYPNSTKSEIMNKGLTEYGKEAIREMNRLGMLIDVSHLSDGGFWQVAQLSSVPFIASHSNCRALTPHPRNLSDEMIRKLAECGGVAGLNLYPGFVDRKVKESTCANVTVHCREEDEEGVHMEDNLEKQKQVFVSRVEDLAEHVLHFIRVGGEECVGIGSDFDGIEGELEIDSPVKMELLFNVLSKKGITYTQLEKIASGNVLRVIQESMK